MKSCTVFKKETKKMYKCPQYKKKEYVQCAKIET